MGQHSIQYDFQPLYHDHINNHLIYYNYNFNNGSWSGSITAGFLANCADQWEMAIHDSGTRVVSPFAFYGGGSNYILMGRDIGWGTTYVQAAESFRAPIFYDSNDTGYYLDPNSTSTSLRYAGYLIQNNTGNYGLKTVSGNAHLHIDDPWNNIHLKHTTGGFYVDANAHHFRNNDGTEWALLNSDYFYHYSDVRSPIFYDNDDTASRWTGDRLYLRGGDPTIYFRDTDHNVAMLHCNSNVFYILRGATDSESWATVNGYWPMEINLTNNNATFGGTVTAPTFSGAFSGNATTATTWQTARNFSISKSPAAWRFLYASS